MARHMHIESTQGGMALGADGSSWPKSGVEVLEAIDDLTAPGAPQPASGEDWAAFLKVLRFILTKMAGGIMEAQVSMMCTFISAMAYTDQVDPGLRRAIEMIKGKTKADADPAALVQSFASAAAIHELIAEAYASALNGESLDQEAFTSRVMEIYPDSGASGSEQ